MENYMRIPRFLLAALIALTLSYPETSTSATEAKKDSVVKEGMLVSFDYTLTGTDGKVLETSKGRQPLKYIHGRKMMIPGLEKELAGMKVGAEKHVTVKPEDAYGPINKNAFQEVPKEKLPPEGLKVGTILALKSPNGQVRPTRVAEIKEKTVVIDMNHPMAGRTLIFDVKILDIQLPPAPASTQPAKPAAAAKPEAPGKPTAPETK